MKRKLFVLSISLIFLIGKNNLKAQWVTIPDPNFATYLQANFPSCMSGNMMDTTCVSITSTSWLIVSGLGITDLEGIQYFDNLMFVDVSNNYTLQNIPHLPVTITGLNLANCNLDSLPSTLPPNLTQLICSNNDLTFLPTLPSTLTDLTCDENNLTSLPALPNGISSIGCFSNQLTSLPPLPNSLLVLSCGSNLIDSMPTLPTGLLELNCYGNVITSLPPLPSTLYLLYCSGNPITTLPTLPSSLLYLYCGNTYITSIPTLPAGLKTLLVSGDHLSSLPILPNTLQQLIYPYTQVGNLGSLPPNLIELICDSSHTTDLPPLPPTLRTLLIADNPISCVDLSGTDTLVAFDFYNTQISCFSSHDIIVTSSSPDFYTIPPCTFSFNPDGCPVLDNIFGNVYYDNNTNCNPDVSELQLSHVPVQLFQSSSFIQQTISGLIGYSLNTSIGNYDVVIDTTGLPFIESCVYPGIDTNVNLTMVDSIAETVNFGMVCKPGFDVGVFSVYHSSGAFIPGQSVTVNSNIGDAALNYSSVYCNTTGIPGTVQINFSGPVTFVSEAPGALIPSVAGTTLTYSILDFSTISFSDFGIIFNVDTTATSGDQVCMYITVNPTGTDNYYSNNTIHHCFEVLSSYDPNVKEVNPLGNLSFPYNGWLTYTIHFQNTGTAPATDVKVTDVLDSDLDPSTFRFITSSHPASINISGHNAVFKFDNIYLTDSTTNESLSHGFIQYKIKPFASIPDGTIINNTANIYFDYNPAVITNTTSTLIGIIGIESLAELPMNIYPNPASESIQIQFENSSENRRLEITGLLGNKVLTTYVNSSLNQISLEEFSNGIYIVTVTEKDKRCSKKIIVEH